MEPFLYKYFHEQTNDRSEGGLVNIPSDNSLWPESWKTIEYKNYKRAEKISLYNQFTNSLLINLQKQRSSDVSKLTDQNLNIDDISFFLKSAYGLVDANSERRAVPSGGALFPLELYVCVWGRVQGLVPGSYHYDVINHQLDILDLLYPNENDIPLFTKYSWMKDAKGVILISSVFNRSVKKYGSRGYRYILLEAGHVGQNICLAAAERNLSVRPMGGINEEYFENILSFDISRERIIYALTF